MSVLGLHNVQYKDKVKGGELNIEKNQALVFTEETDREYIDVKENVVIVDEVSNLLRDFARVNRGRETWRMLWR